MAVIELTTPVSEEQICQLKVGDTVELSGLLYTGRDAVHHRLHEGEKPPVDLNGMIIYHCGPVILEENGSYPCTAAGPTTSIREEPYQWEVMRDHGIRGVIGKGGMGPKTLAACQEYGCCYFHAIGGAAQFYARCLPRVTGVHLLEEFGIPEAMWEFEAKDFPAIVTMDSHGGSLHAEIEEASGGNLDKLREPVPAN